MDTNWLARIEEKLDATLERQAALEELLLQNLPRKDIHPEFITLDEAALIGGMTKRAVQNRLKQESSSPSGFAIRTLHGKVHKRDWLAYLKHLTERKPKRGQVVREALENILGG